MINTAFIQENLYPFLAGMGSSVAVYLFVKVSKYCCC